MSNPNSDLTQGVIFLLISLTLFGVNIQRLTRMMVDHLPDAFIQHSPSHCAETHAQALSSKAVTAMSVG